MPDDPPHTGSLEVLYDERWRAVEEVFKVIRDKVVGNAFVEVFCDYLLTRTGQSDVLKLLRYDASFLYNLAVSFFGSEEAVRTLIVVSLRHLLVDSLSEADRISLRLIEAFKNGDLDSILDLSCEILLKLKFKS